MGSWSIFHWLIVLIVVVLVFGTGKLKKAGRDLGIALRGFKGGFKEGIKGEHEEGEEILEDKSDDSVLYEQKPEGPDQEPIKQESGKV